MDDSMTPKELMKLYRNGKLTPEHYGDYWNDEDRQQLKGMFREGEGLSEIALRLERSESSVFQQLVSMELFADSRASRAKRKGSAGCRCEGCSAREGERPCYCPFLTCTE